jgi:predicted acetyltransferase
VTSDPPDGIDIVQLPTDRMEEFVRAASIPFSFDPDDDIVESSQNLDPGRVIAALDDDRVVGTAASIPFSVTVPGGARLLSAGVTFVAVLPSHRRRGVLTAMMRRLLDDAHDRGEPLASLWASETMIYGRYGFGEAVEMVSYEVKRSRSAFRAPVEPSGRMRVIDADEAVSVLPPFHDSLDWVGKFGRSVGHWRSWVLWDPEFDRDGFTKRRIAVYEEDGIVGGYTFFRTNRSDSGGRVRVDEVVAPSPAAQVAVYRFLFGIDLIDTLVFRAQRGDEPLRWMLEDTRAFTRRSSEYMWFRLLDVPVCLAARTYERDGRLVLEVTDRFAPRNHGRWLLESSAAEVTCMATDAEPDLTLDVSDVGALSMGGRSALTMAAAGRISGSPEAVAVADAMFRIPEPPWSPETY